MATITYSSSRVTITGTYKEFLGSSTTTVVTRSSGDSPASGDVGRFILWCRGGQTNTDVWEIRRITGATTSTVTVHDPWTTTPSAGDTFRISSTMDDILSAQPSAGTKTGDSTYYINGDFSLASNAFLGAADITVEWRFNGANPVVPIANNCALQLGQLWGGEGGSAVETTNGCRWYYNQTGSGSNSVYSAANARVANGAVINYYGSLIESKVGGGYQFQRMLGPTRFIGSIFDGPMGGRFYHEAAEWVDCRMSGNDSATPAWSIGATFTRPIDNVIFYRNLFCMKNYQTFGGTFKNCTFTDSNGDVISVTGSVGSIFNYIDCTEFDDSLIADSGSGILNQYRSVNFTTTTDAGATLSDVIVRINDKDDTTQGSVQTSDGSGVCGEILALRRQWTNSSPSVLNNPFRIRIRKFGYFWGSLNSAIADKIKQSYAMIPDPNVTQSSGTAAAHTGITVTDHGGSPVSWNGKNWGITVEGNLTTNSSLTLDDIKHYLHYNLSQSGTTFGKASGLHWHDLIPMSSLSSERGDYGGTFKGVRIIDENGDPFPGIIQLQSDDGTYYVAPITLPVSITNITANSRLQIFNVTTDTEVYNAIVTGTSYNSNYIEGSDYTAGDTVRVRLTYQNGTTAKHGFESTTVATSGGWAVLANQTDDDVYIAYGVDGSTITYLTADYVNGEVDINSATNFPGSEMYAWWVYNIYTSQGINDFFGALTAVDDANILNNTTVAALKIDNLTTTNVYQTDNIRLYRSDGVYPVKNPTTGGGGVDINWRNVVYIAETGTSGLTTGEAATLAKLDTLTEDSGGLRFTDKALEQAASTVLDNLKKHVTAMSQA